jgi:hypothetical protein
MRCCPERGLALAEAAIAELGAVDDAERMALMLRRRAGLRQELLLPGQLDDLHVALHLAGAPSLVRAHVLARLCWALKREDRYAESEQMAVDLRALAEQLGDEEHRVEADMALASLGALRGKDYARTWSCGPGARTGPGHCTRPGPQPSPRKRPALTAVAT